MTTRDDLAADARLRNDPAFREMARRACLRVAAQELAATGAEVDAAIAQADTVGDRDQAVWHRSRRVLIRAAVRVPATWKGFPLVIYAWCMDRRDGEPDRLRALVEGAD
jgi:hypothetical protein